MKTSLAGFLTVLFYMSICCSSNPQPLMAQETQANVQFHPLPRSRKVFKPEVSLGAFSYQLHQGKIELWSHPKGKYIRTLEPPAQFKQTLIELKVAGNHLLSFSNDGHVLIWDGLNGTYLKSLNILSEDQMATLKKRDDYFYAGIPQPLWTHDSNTLAVLVPQRKLQLRDSHTGQVISQTTSDLYAINQTSLSEDGYYEWLENGWARVYSLPNLELLQYFLPIPHGDNTSGALKGPYLALNQTVSAQPAIEVYDLRSQTKIFEWLTPPDKQFSFYLDWVSDQVLHIFDNQEEIHDFWQIESGKKGGTRSNYSSCVQQSVTQDGKVVCFKEQQALIYDLDAPENDQVWTFPGVDYADEFRSVFPAAYFIWLNRHAFSVKYFSKWDATPLEFQIPNGVSAWAVNRDTFFMLDNDNKIQRWDLKHNQKLPNWEISLKQDIEIKSSQDWLLSTGIEPEVHLRDLKTGRKTILSLPPGEVSALALSQDYLAVGLSSQSGSKIALWSRVHKRWMPTLKAHQGKIKQLSFLDQRHLLTLGSEQKLSIWQVLKSQPLDEIQLFPDTNVDFSLQGIQVTNKTTQKSLFVDVKKTKEKNWHFQVDPSDLLALQSRSTPVKLAESPLLTTTKQPHTLDEDQGFWLDLENQKLIVSEPHQVTVRDLKHPETSLKFNPCLKSKQQPCVIIGAQSEQDYFWILTDSVLSRKILPQRGAVPDAGYYSDIQPTLHIYQFKDSKFIQSLQIPPFASMYHNLNVLRKGDAPNQIYFYDYTEGKFLSIELAKGKVKKGLPNYLEEMLSDSSPSRCHERDPRLIDFAYCKVGNTRMNNNPYFFQQFPGGYLLMLPNGYFMAEGPFQEYSYLTQNNEILDWHSFSAKYHSPQKILAYFEGKIDPFEFTLGGEKR